MNQFHIYFLVLFNLLYYGWALLVLPPHDASVGDHFWLEAYTGKLLKYANGPCNLTRFWF